MEARRTASGSVAPAALDPTNLPVHIAIIMDGNGRWAASRGLSRAAGHQAGVDAARRTVRACDALGIRALTLFAFSTENWSRPTAEVDALMDLLGRAVRDEAQELMARGVRIQVSGDLTELDAALREQIEQIVALTQPNPGLVLNIAYNYGGRAEILQAVRAMAADLQAGRVTGEIDEDLLRRYLYTPDLPDPDLLIRTGGEQRISNFLLWQLAYTELYFCDVYWPDFSEADLTAALRSYQQRLRRYGGVKGT
ncbi:MAG TPA: isoprenyl transferase [bacterium]|jgi:undecaprenyl diphosphate synthase